jgi:hypothetical protein
MKRILTLVAPLIVLGGSVAAAPGLNLGWNLACPTTAASAPDMVDPCETNFNLYYLVGSVRAPPGLSRVTAEELVIDLQEGAPILSPWWHLEDVTALDAAGCRGLDPLQNPAGSLSVTAAFQGLSQSPCRSYWAVGGTSGGYNYVPGYGGPNRARLRAVFARQAVLAGPLTADAQYYVFIATLDMQHTVPDPTLPPPGNSCLGCQDGVCIVFSSCKLDQPPGTPNGDSTIINQDVRQFVTWQGGAGTICPSATPTRHATWGMVKSLYR